MSPDDQTLAAELALGLLEGPDLAVAQARLRAEPDFAAEVSWWRERCGALSAAGTEAAPPADMWNRIEAGLATPVAAPTATGGRRLPWFAGGALAGALAASLAAVLLVPAPRTIERVVRVPVVTPAAPPLVAILAPGEGTAREPVAAVFDRQTRTLRLTATISVPEDRAAELWRIGSDNVPRALGLLTAGERAPIRIDADLSLQADEIIAISIEPLGGSPTGTPTGEVIASGALQPT
ncbi:anti-sigma factor [Croceibacterium sp. TMG7-5b_MA50]|uniref:anti-sigma factor n=1 Tax=Croceibacterium sp. TMG7-5b_MA50 TaxID=3121290 RepID=UPI003221615E